MLSIIIPVWGTTHKNNAECVIRSWEHCDNSDTELLIMEPDCKPCLDYYGKSTRIQTKDNPNIWLLSILRNAGVKYSKYDLMCFHDCDAIITNEWLNEIKKSTHQAFPTYNSVAYLTRESTDNIIRAISNNNKYHRSVQYISIRDTCIGDGCGLSFCITKDHYYKIGEWMVLPGWGGEDQEYGRRYNRYFSCKLRSRALHVNLLHLDHEIADKSKVDENIKLAKLGG